MSGAPAGVVLTATALVSSPSVWMLYQGSLSSDEVVKRVLICLVVCWVALSVVSAVVFPSATSRTPDPGGPADPAAGHDVLGNPGRSA